MVLSGCTVERRVETDCHQPSPCVAGCSPRHSTQANDISVLKAIPSRRQSPRLKAINAIYKAEDAMSSNLWQTSGDNSPGSFQIKVETASDDSSVNVTLKDLQARCKSKKRKALKSVDSSTSDVNHVLLKPKDEDDLEEPLICLKLKKSNKSSLRKQRKHSHPSDSILPVEERTLQTPHQSFCRKESSSPVKTDSSSIVVEVAAEDECNSIPESVNKNLEVSSDKDPLHVGGPNLRKLSQKFCEEESADGESYSSPRKFLHPCVTSHTEMTSCYSSPTVSQKGASLVVDISQSINGVKGEAIVIGPLTHNSGAYVSASSDLNFIGKFNDLGNSSSVLHERTDGSEQELGDTTNFMTESLDCCTNESSFEVTEVENCANLPESSKRPLDCCVNDVSIEFMETNNYTSPPESSKELCGEKMEVDPSEMSCNKLLYDCILNQMDSLATSDIQEIKTERNSLEFRMTKEFEDRGDDIPVLAVPACSRENNVTNKCSILSRSMYDFHSCFSGEVGSLDSLVLKALGGNALRNNNENHALFHVGKSSSVGTYDCCISPHSSFSSPFDSHATNATSPDTGTLHCSVNKMLNHYTEKAAESETDAEELINSCIEKRSLAGMYDPCIPQHSNTSFGSSSDLYAVNGSAPEAESSQCSSVNQTSHCYAEKAAHSPETSGEELVEVFECHSPQDSLPDSGAVNGLLDVEDSLSKVSKRNQSSAENMLCRTVHMPTCHSSETSNLIEVEGSKTENELNCGRGLNVEHSPKNLLSNRKDLSPISQEKLCRAFSGNELDNAMKTANHEESSERITKRSESSKNSSPKGILKSPDFPDRNCSCSNNSMIHTQAQKAVTFSQRQMQDIENIAARLLKGLASMKHIVMESVGSEACLSASSNLPPEEVRMAIENASNLESTTKKWLSMMAKDCHRFCKIMKSTENKGAASVGVKKQPKKITFADEAGGLLCHVKVFEQLPQTITNSAPLS